MIAILLAAATVATAPSDTAFRAWATDYAAKHQMQLTSWGPAHLDEVKGTQRLAVMVGDQDDATDGPFAVLVEDGPRHWVHAPDADTLTAAIPHPPDGHVAVKDQNGKPEWKLWPSATLDFANGYSTSHGWDMHCGATVG
jgi:hypothetical protein